VVLQEKVFEHGKIIAERRGEGDIVELLGLSVRWPVIAAPMAGGPSTVALCAAVSEAGGLGFLAAGYKTTQAMVDEIAGVRALTTAPFGVNLFVPGQPALDRGVIDEYLAGLRDEADRFQVALDARWDDDSWPEKLEALASLGVPLVSFTFGCPDAAEVDGLHRAGSAVIVSVTSPEEATVAAEAGADAIGAQGIEAGHRLSRLVPAIRDRVDLPVIAAGGLMTGLDVARVIDSGAIAGQLGTAFLRSPESGAHDIYKAALADPAYDGTAITRAFSGRRARGVVNRFMLAHPDAPAATYPEINNATRALRAEAVRRGDPGSINLWAGEGYALASDRPAAEILARLGAEYERAVG
jgi:nitronate monooxygenase